MKFTQDIKTIWYWIKPFKKKIWAILALAIFASAISALIPYIYGYLVDAVIAKKEILLIFGTLGLWLILSFVADIIGRFNYRRGEKLAVSAGNRLVFNLTHHIIALPLSFHQTKKMGEVIRKITTADSYLSRIVSEVALYALPQLLTVLVALVFLFTINFKLCLLLFVILAIYVVATIFKTKPVIRQNKKLNLAYEKTYGDLFDSLHNVQVVKSNTNEEYEKKSQPRISATLWQLMLFLLKNGAI